MSRISVPFFDGTGPIAGCILAATARGLTIDQPAWGGADVAKQLVLGSIAKNLNVWVDYTGTKQTGGISRYEDVDEFTWQATKSTTNNGMSFAHISFHVTTLTQPITAGQIIIPNVDHTGKIDFNLRATYKTNSTTVVGASKVASVGCNYLAGVLTLGPFDDMTPSSQADANLVNPTVSLGTVSGVKYLFFKVSSCGLAYNNGLTYWAGGVALLHASSYER